MKKIGTLLLTITLVTAMLLSGCAKKGTSSAGGNTGSNAGGKPVIGVSLMTLQYPFFQDIKAGIEEAAADKYEVKFHDAALDLQSQIDAIENYVAQNVSAIILNAVDSDGIVTALEAAAAKNIPVITVDMKPSSGTFATFIGSDNYMGGELAAQFAANTILEGKTAPKIVLLNNPLSSASTERINGFKDKITSLFPDAEFVAEKGTDTREKFMSAMEDILISNAEIDVVFAYSAQGGLGAYDAIQAAARDKEISVIGFDATDEEQVEIAKGGAYKGSVIQFPDELGKKCVQSVSDVLDGKKLDENIPVEVGVYAADKVYSAADLK